MSEEQKQQMDAETKDAIECLKEKVRERERPLLEKEGFKFDSFNRFTNYLKISEEFWKEQPFHYDQHKIWWLWNLKEKRWEKVDETDLMIALDVMTKYPSTNSKIKGEIIESMKRVGRKNKPKEAKRTWIQFRKKIYDLETGNIFNATPKYFITNPIPHIIGESTDTPTMDRIFREWVVKEGIQDETYIKTLYEIMAYTMLAWMPIHRIFCFIGEGLNGKGTFLRMIGNLLGEENYCASEVEILSSNRFESNKLFRKLACFIGEVDRGIFKKTKTIKSLTGEDTVRVEFKGKDGFDSQNYANPLIATNHLPETGDKTKGFYRRWTIVDFPNRFHERTDVLAQIPEEEYSNFCRKAIDEILPELIKRGEFTNDGTIEQREDKYEKHSNLVNEFIRLYTDKDEESYIEFSDFVEKYNEYLRSEGLPTKSKIEVGRAITLKGYDKKVKAVQGVYDKTTKMCILKIKWKEDVLEI